MAIGLSIGIMDFYLDTDQIPCFHRAKSPKVFSRRVGSCWLSRFLWGYLPPIVKLEKLVTLTSGVGSCPHLRRPLR